MLAELKHALASLRKSPGFTLVAVFTLTLGIGANTAIFSLVYSLFLQGLPFERPQELVRITCEDPARNLRQIGFSVPRIQHYRASQTVFTDVAAEGFYSMTLSGFGDPVQISAVRVTANYLSVLGLRPVMGRSFLPAEESDSYVTLVSASFWRNRLNSDPHVLERTVTLDNLTYSIIGVVPDLPAVWAGLNLEVIVNRPFELPGSAREQVMRGASFLRTTARLKPGVQLEQVLAALRPIHASYQAQFAGNFDATYTPAVVSVGETATGNLRPAFITLLAAVGFVLLIACSNVANLLLVRFSSRRREIAVRIALGAPRASIIRLFVLESTLVALLAGVLGEFLAWRILALVPYLTDGNLPIDPDIALPPALHLFTLGVCLLTGFAMGFYPALQCSRTDVVDGLKDGGRSGTGSPAQLRFRCGLLSAQVALSLVLLVCASMLMSSFSRLNRQELGFRTDHLGIGTINLPVARYADIAKRSQYAERLLNELRSSPGVESASLAFPVPLSGFDVRTPYARADQNPLPISQRALGLVRYVTPGHFQTLAIPLVAGRDFSERDQANQPHVAIISRSTAKKIFPNEDPLGRHMLFSTNNGTGQDVEIVGIVGDVRSVGIAQVNDVELYRPMAQRNTSVFQVVVRTAGDPAAASALIRAAMNRLDPDLPLTRPTTMEAIAASSLSQQRLLMSMLGSFATVALVLTLVGIYGLVAYSVAQRTTEVGIRLALGSTPAQVVALMLTDGMRPVAWGLGLGLAGALAVGQILASQLYQTSAFDPLLLTAITGLLAVIAAAACIVPARRAAAVSPLAALRG